MEDFDNETIIKNDVLTKDNLISVSNGMATDFKLISSNRNIRQENQKV